MSFGPCKYYENINRGLDWLEKEVERTLEQGSLKQEIDRIEKEVKYPNLEYVKS